MTGKLLLDSRFTCGYGVELHASKTPASACETDPGNGRDLVRSPRVTDSKPVPRPTRLGPMWPMPVRVDKWFTKHIRPAGECWEWIGSRTMNGYGQLRIAGKPSMAHRALYEYFVADIPAGLDLDHLCRNRACVNPWHLEPVTRSTNLFRAANMGKHNTDKTRCPQQHPYDEANTRITTKGSRACRTCERLRAAEKRRQKADASCG